MPADAPLVSRRCTGHQSGMLDWQASPKFARIDESAALARAELRDCGLFGARTA